MTSYNINTLSGGTVSGSLTTQQHGSQIPIDLPSLGTRAIDALTPTLFRIAKECRAIYGCTNGAILVNLIGITSFAAAGNFRVRGHNGKAMPLSLHARFIGPPLSGKSEAVDRFMAPVMAGMKGHTKPWRFADVTPAGLKRALRLGAVLGILVNSEGTVHLKGPLSRSFEDLSELYDANVPAYLRADNVENIEIVEPDSAVFVSCLNVQNERHRAWMDRHANEGIEQGYFFRLLVLETDELAAQGAGALQPELALLDFDQRILELMVSARSKLDAITPRQLPVLDVTPDAEIALREAAIRFQNMATVGLQARYVLPFAIRLSANVRRIAACMHAFERYVGGISLNTMMRAVTIGECFAAHWLACVNPPKPLPTDEQDALVLLPNLLQELEARGVRGIRESEVVTLAKNLKWMPQRTKKALMVLYSSGEFKLIPRTINGRRVEMVEH